MDDVSGVGVSSRRMPLRTLLLLVTVWLVSNLGPAHANDTHWLDGSWVVDVTLDKRPRLFEVKVRRGLLGGLNVDAKYGYADGSIDPVDVTLEGRGEDAEVSFVSRAKSKVFVRRVSAHELAGTIVTQKGVHGTVVMRRASSADVQKAKGALGAPAGVTLLDPDTQLAEVKQSLGGVWRSGNGKVVVEIRSLAQKSSGIEALGTYSFERGPSHPLKAVVTVDGGTMAVHLWTPTNAKLALTEAGPDTLTGTLTPSSGRESRMTMSRIEAKDVTATPLGGITLVVIYRHT
jgi:hypothetical protein